MTNATGEVAMASVSGNPRPGQEEFREPGDHSVDVPITCVLSRFELRSARHMVSSYRDYSRVVRELRQSGTPGFMRAAFLVENPTTWFGLSLWKDTDAIAHFGTDVPRHVDAARTVFGRLGYDSKRPDAVVDQMAAGFGEP